MMKLRDAENLAIVASILYTATVPNQVSKQFRSALNDVPIRLIVLGGIFMVSLTSLRTAVFLALAYIATITNFAEYLDAKEQTPKHEQPKSSGVTSPELKGVLNELMKSTDKLFKGDTRLPQHTQRKGDAPKKLPEPTLPVTPATSKKTEHFSMY